MKIEYATAADAHDIEELWHEVFGDDPDDIRSFLSCFLERDTAFVIRDHDGIAAMLFLIEATLCEDDKTWSVGYIYAGATKSSQRGKGLYKRLLAAAEAEARNRNMAAIFLQPADDSLAKTYERHSFTLPLYVHASKGTTLSAETPFESVSVTEYQTLRRRLLTEKGVPFIEWPTALYKYCARWSKAVVCEQYVALLDEQATVLERIDRTDANDRKPLGQMKLLLDIELCDQTCLYMGYAMD